ncbi:MAG TPA: hypothetical protein PL105_01090 [Caldilineaceae bacterium]|nr:hypothetical protein [Caldilineaceae bacterium]
MSDSNGTGAYEAEAVRPIIEGYRPGGEGDEAWALMEGRLAELESLLSGGDWRLISMQAEQEFSREGLRQITEMARIMYLKNPLIQRGIDVKRFYVWGQGVSVKAADSDIHEAIKAFEEDEKNVVSLTSHQARMSAEVELETDGNLFFVFFVSPTTGRVRVRTVAFGEIAEVVCNPEDSKEPWYYLRRWQERRMSAGGARESVSRTAWYPDWRYNPTAKPATLDGHPVQWGQSMYHVKVGGFSDWTFGISEVYDTIDWALAYKEFLEDWASIVRAYRRFAFQLTTPGGRRGIAAAKSKLNTTLGNGSGSEPETVPPPVVGSTFISSPDVSLQPVRTSGATVSAEDGRRLLLMVAASTGLPETFFGDASVGSLATAKSLDRPTELAMTDRQTLWADILGDIYRFVAFWGVKAANGPLRGLGRIERTVEDGVIEERVIWNEDIDPTISVTFPPLVEGDVKERVEALVAAATLGKAGTLAGTMDLPTLARMLLIALGADDVDEVVERLFPDGEVPDATGPERSAAEAGMVEALRELRQALER